MADAAAPAAAPAGASDVAAGQAAVETDKANTLSAMAAQGSQGVAAYEQAKSDMAAENQRAIAAAQAEAAMRGAPAGMQAGISGGIISATSPFMQANTANEAQFKASQAAMQGNYGGYFAAAKAAGPAILAHIQSRLLPAQQAHQFRMEQMQQDHQARMDELKSIADEKAQVRAQQAKMAQLGYDFKVKQLDQYAKGLDIKALGAAGLSGSSATSELHYQQTYNLKLRQQQLAEAKFVVANQRNARNDQVTNYVKLQGVRTANQRQALAEAVAQDRSGLAHNAQTFDQAYKRANLEISQGRLDLSRQSAQFNQALSRARFITQGQQWAANQAATESRFARGQAATQNRFDTSQSTSASRWNVSNARANTAAAQTTDRYNAWVGAGRPAGGSAAARLTPEQQGINDARRTQSRNQWNTANNVTGRGTVTERRNRVLSDIMGTPEGRPSTAAFRAFQTLISHAKSPADFNVGVEAWLKSKQLAPPGRGTRVMPDSGVMRAWGDRYYNA